MKLLTYSKLYPKNEIIFDFPSFFFFLNESVNIRRYLSEIGSGINCFSGKHPTLLERRPSFQDG